LGVLTAGLVPAVNDAGNLGVVFLCGFNSACSTVALCGLVVVAGGEKTGNLVFDVFSCLKRPTLVECTMPGEYEDSEVGVEPRLHMPGDSEYLVEGVLAEGMRGVLEGGRGSVETAVRRLASSTGP
jgi:methyl coenzyme M reductase subunit C